ncbi:MAG TPA: hypothetical protein VEA78_12475 [Acidimicrobiales bacterium]|nr:hypothetical protein [Acidimicrobiales bacterium]
MIAGNYFGRAVDVTWPRADTLVWLDLPLPLIVARSVRRTVKRGLTRELVCNGNREKLRFLVPQKLGGPEMPLWQYAIQHHRYMTPIIEDLVREERFAHLDVHRLTSRRQVAAF